MICERTITKRHLNDFVEIYKAGILEDIPVRCLAGFNTDEIIEKIFNNESISSFVIKHELDEQGNDKYTMVDGKKRMATILWYATRELENETNERQRNFLNFVVPVEFVYK